MAATILNSASLTFGTSDESSFVVKSYEETIKCDPIELLSGDGIFQAVAISNPNSSATITIVSNSQTASIGSAFSLNGNASLSGMDTLYIDSCSKTMTNDGFVEAQITAVGWGNLGSAT